MIFCVAFVQKASQRAAYGYSGIEDKYGSQLELIFRFIDRALALAYWRKWRTSMNLEALPKYSPQNLQN